MKWPRKLVLISPGETDFDVFQGEMWRNPDYVKFVDEFAKDPSSLATEDLARTLREDVRPPSSEFSAILTENGRNQARLTGEKLMKIFGDQPERIFLGPCPMIRETLSAIEEGWTNLSKATRIEDERLRPQNLGLAHLYPDPQIFLALEKEQRRLMELLGPHHYGFPQGEAMIEVRDRSRGVTGAFVRDHPGNYIVVIAPARILIALQANFQTLAEAEFIDFWLKARNGHCSVSFYTNPFGGKNSKERLRLEFQNQCLWEE